MSLKLLLKLSPTWKLCYEGEAGAGTGTGTETGTETGTGTGTSGADDDKPTLSQKKVNALMAEEKRKHKVIIDKQVADLEQLKKSKGLTEKEKSDLTTRIEELNNTMLTKEQLGQKETEKLKNEHKTVLESTSKDRDTWKTLFYGSTIERSITDAAVTAEAFSPAQIVALLKPNTRLAEVLDAEGQPIPGQFVPKVTMQDVDKDNKPVTLDLTVSEALKRMKDRAAEFGNLFKSGVQGGLGGKGSQAGGKNEDPAKMTPEDYRKWRNNRLNRKLKA